MRSPRICIAGIDTQTKRHLRPVTDSGQPLTRDLLAAAGGPFEIGALVELGDVEACPVHPETEDNRFQPSCAERVALLDGDDYLALLNEVGADDLDQAFGSALQRHEWKYAVDAGTGERSLGCLRARRRPDISLDDRFGKLQLRFNDPEKPAFLTIADLRLYEEDQKTPRLEVVADIRGRLQRGVPVWLMFGLARAFRAAGDSVDRHWLQVNGLCLEDSPLGPLP